MVRLVQPIPQLEGFEQLLTDYWNAVSNQMQRQEMSFGPIRRIFAETVLGRGDDAMLMLRQMNPGAHQLARSMVASGAKFEDLEDTELLHEVIDWTQCASQRISSQKVRSIIENGHREASEARMTHVANRLEEAIAEGESALVFVVSATMPIPEGIERFIVSPPELDRLERWLQAKMEEAQRELAAQAQAHSHSPSPESPNPSQTSGGGLWTPS